MAVEQDQVTNGDDRVGRRPRFVAWPSALVALAGVWLMMTPVLLDRAGSRSGIWSDVLTGAALVVVALLRLVSPIRTALLGLVNVALGVWLVIAPFALHYHGTSVPGRANDLLVGILVTVLAMLGTINCSFAWQPRRVHRV